MSGTEIDIEWVRQIANETSGKIRSDAQTNTAEFRNNTVDPAAFGTLTESAQYAGQVDAAHAFFTQTIEAVLADLDDFATNLRVSADAHETTDGDAHAALTSLDTIYEQRDETDYRSHEDNQSSTSDEDLQGVDPAGQTDGGGYTDSGAAASDGQPTEQGGDGSGYGSSGTGSDTPSGSTGSGYGS